MKTKTRQSEISLNQLVGVGVSLVLIGLVFVYGVDIAKDIKDIDNTCPTTSDYAYNASAGTCMNSTGSTIAPTNEDFAVANQTIEALGEIPTKLPTIAMILAVSVIIFVLMRSFAMK